MSEKYDDIKMIGLFNVKKISESLNIVLSYLEDDQDMFNVAKVLAKELDIHINVLEFLIEKF